MKRQPKLSSIIDKACFDYNLIEKGDRILIGASGCKDSTALIEYFANRAKRPDCGFEYKALFIKSDFAPEFPEGIMTKFQERNGATQCKLLKGVGTKVVLRECPLCVADAAEFLEEQISCG